MVLAQAAHAYNGVTMWTMIDSPPTSVSFTAYYDDNDSKIQTEDSFNNSSTTPHEGWWFEAGVARVQTDQITGLTSNTLYKIWVASSNAAGTASGTIGTSDPSFTDGGTPLVLSSNNYLAIPANFQAAGVPGKITLTWSPVADATGYRIYRRNTNPTVYVYDKKTPSEVTSTTWDDDSATIGVSYSYIVVATANGKRSGHTPEMSAIAQLLPPNQAPNAPTSLTQQGVANGDWVTSNFNITMSMRDLDNSGTLTPQVEITSEALSFSGTPNLNGTEVINNGSAVPGTVTVNTASLTDGNYKWQARVKDNLGATSNFVQYNSGSTAFRIDRTAPSPVAITPPANPTSNPSLAFSWTAATDNGSGPTGVYYYLLNTSPSTDVVDVMGNGESTTTRSVTKPGVQGSNYLHVVAVDYAGNRSIAHSVPVVVDNQAPGQPTGISATPSTWSKNNTFAISWTNPVDAAGIAGAYYKIGTAPTGNTDGTLVTGAAISSVNVTPSASGQYTVYVWLKDGAGNVDYHNNNNTSIQYDATGPAFPGGAVITTPYSPTNSSSLTFSWPAAADSQSGLPANNKYYYLLDQTSTATAGAVALGTGTNNLTVSVNVYTDGTYYLHVISQDAAGNLSSVLDSTPVVLDKVAPSITSTVPIDGTTGVSKDLTQIMINFSEEMNGALASDKTKYTVTGSKSGVHTINSAAYLNRAVTLGVSGFANDELVTFTVNSAVKDSAGNSLSGKNSFVFTTSNTNHAPVANDQSVSTDEDIAKAITLGGSDADSGDTLTYSIVASPAHGNLTGTGANRTYTPAANYNGADSFTFKINDGTVDSNVATVSITVNAVNDAPVMTSATINPASPKVTDTLSAAGVATDIDSVNISYSYQWKKNGTVIGGQTGQTLASGNFARGDSIKVVITPSDGLLSGNPMESAAVVIGSTPPVANDQSVSTNEDAQQSITLVASDADLDPLTYSIVSGPTHGNLSGGSDANRTYTPNANYSGTDSFTFKAYDGQAYSNVATVSITINPVNDAPVMTSATINPASPKVTDTLSATGVATDVDTPIGNITYTYQWKKNGVVITGQTGQTLASGNFARNDSIKVVITPSDGSLSGSPMESAAVVIGSTPPVANDQSVSTNEDAQQSITLVASDADLDPLTYSIVSGPTHGSLSSGSDANRTYTPASNYNGTDSFTFKAYDGQAYSNTATVTITVNPVNDAPVANNQNGVMTNQDTSVGVTLTASDVDNTTLNYIVVTQPQHGSLSGSGANQTYTPAAGYYGSDFFTFKANDTQLDSNVATVNITVNHQNHAPVANGQSVSTDEDTQQSITLSGSDADSGDPLNYSIVANPAHGTLTGNAPILTYTPAANYNGADSFTFKVNDGTVDSNNATVIIAVNPVNDAPVATNLSLTTDQNTAVAAGLSASDADRDQLNYVIVSNPLHGNLSGAAPNLIYTPATDYYGSDSFIFKANDGKIDSNPATVTIAVNPTSINNLFIQVEEGKVKLYVRDGAGNQSALIYYDSVGYAITGQESGNSIGSDGTVTEGAQDGTYTLTATVTIGAMTLTASCDHSINKSAPVVTVKVDSHDLDNDLTISNKPKLDIQASDGNGIKAVHVYIDNVELAGQSLTAQGVGNSAVTASYTPDASLSVGSHSLRIEAEDNFGTVTRVSALGLKVYDTLQLQGKPMNYPNPFKPSVSATKINYTLTTNADIKIMIYDFTGRMVAVKTFAAGIEDGGLAGENNPAWDGKNFNGEYVGNGVYVYFITSGGKVLASGEMSVYE
jgi:hypothetical protein